MQNMQDDARFAEMFVRGQWAAKAQAPSRIAYVSASDATVGAVIWVMNSSSALQLCPVWGPLPVQCAVLVSAVQLESQPCTLSHLQPIDTGLSI